MPVFQFGVTVGYLHRSCDGGTLTGFCHQFRNDLSAMRRPRYGGGRVRLNARVWLCLPRSQCDLGDGAAVADHPKCTLRPCTRP